MASGIVFGGGGVRGSYHIGVYKALMEMSRYPSVVCGTSIGAINGAIIAQGDFDILENLWQNIKIDDILKISECRKGNKNLFCFNCIPEFFKQISRKKGIDSTPLRKLILKYVNERKLKESPVDFALVTYSVTDKRMVVKYKNQIPEGELADYLMASAAFPGFETVKIGRKKFVDGGVVDNIPLSVVAKYGVQDIIVVDVGGVGIVRNADISGKNVITIRSEKPVVGIMEFDTKQIRNNIQLGYLDAKRAYGKVVGDIYYINTDDYYNARGFYSGELISGVEKAARIFEVDILREYTVEELVLAVRDEFKKKKKTDNPLEIIKNMSKKEVISNIAYAMLMKKTEILANKAVREILGKWYDAASAIAYFCK